ncbi:MAG: hypothetical protein HOC20_07185 [Chloroflexi bacterium]|jgi:hypothetical protein|nr:hypothetical protein [Chloroflexota bacterium]
MLESGARMPTKTRSEAMVFIGRKAMVWLARVRNPSDMDMIIPLKRLWSMMGSDGTKSHLDLGYDQDRSIANSEDRLEGIFASVAWGQRTLFSEMNS